ncbi:MAG: hypothetical protein KDC92_07535 [Bacteroidetes bacterium]|nr:hypothetical protein [Bacteroidota bacterium]
MRLVLGLLLVIGISSCSVFKRKQKRYLPDNIDKNVHFGMSLKEFKNLKGNKVSLYAEESFRKAYLENLNDDELVSIVYYFDEDGDKPLYEVILDYKDKNGRDEEAAELFGDPNDGDEWSFKEAKPWPIKAWTYKSKLIVVAVIPNTEWWDEEQ